MSPADLFDTPDPPDGPDGPDLPEPQPLSQAEKLDWLRLIRTDHVGPITFKRLLDQFGSAGAALEALPDLSQRGGRRRALKPCSAAKARQELDRLQGLDAQIVALGEPGYPPGLAVLEDGPPLLIYRGHLGLLQRPCVAVVGSRNASIGSMQFANHLAQELAQSGVCVVSGLARGLDTAAHSGALRAQSTTGGTAAVMAGGIDIIYPAENTELHGHIVQAGVVVTEIQPGEQPQARHFPRRNRIVSGLSLGVVVVEGASRSGSLITARLANDQGREVMAVPGPPGDPRASGPNALIKQGAHLIENAQDVLRVIQPLRHQPLREPPGLAFRREFKALKDHPVHSQDAADALSQARETLHGLLGGGPVTVDEILRQCQLSAAQGAILLLELELAGRLERLPGNMIQPIR